MKVYQLREAIIVRHEKQDRYAASVAALPTAMLEE